jgi:uncharacterized membrane protein
MEIDGSCAKCGITVTVEAAGLAWFWTVKLMVVESLLIVGMLISYSRAAIS